MKNIKYIITLIAISILCLTSCDEKLEINDNNIENKASVPEIASFSPTSGSAGTQVTIKGSGFAFADSVLINNVKTNIKTKISDSEILVELTGMETSGKIDVYNFKGVGQSKDNFSVFYKVPENLQVSIESGVLKSGMPVVIEGENLKTVQEVYLSGTTDRIAKILFQTDEKLIFEIPVICDSQAKIKLEYYEQTDVKYWESTQYPTDKVIVPPVLVSSPTRAYLGQVIYIDITNADRIDALNFGTKNLQFDLVSDSRISVTLPNDLTENTTSNLWMIHNACDNEDIISDFMITIPTFYTYFDIRLTAQGGNGGGTGANAEAGFFDAEGGGTYTTCEAVQHPTEIEFATYSNGNGGFVFYGPQALLDGTIKNYYCGTTALNKLMDMAAFNGVEVLFRRLDVNNATQKALIDKFNGNEITDLSDAAFEGITAPSSKNISYFKNTTGNSTYTPGEIIWFRNGKTGKNGLMRVNVVDYSGTGQDKFSSAQADILYQK